MKTFLTILCLALLLHDATADAAEGSGENPSTDIWGVAPADARKICFGNMEN
jgi:hypothetical protein